MIKRAGIILMALLYLSTATGFYVNLHYCDDRIADLKINAPVETCLNEPADDCADPIAMPGSKLAAGKMNCKNSHFVIKVKDDHQKESTSFNGFQFAAELPALRVYDFLSLKLQLQPNLHTDRDPPDLSPASISVFLKNCTFRI